MTSLGTLSRSSTVALLLAAACGHGITDFDAAAARQSAATPSPSDPDGTSILNPPTLDVEVISETGLLTTHFPTGFVPYSGPLYRLDFKGTGFQPRREWTAAIVATLPDGIVIMAGGGGGANPADGTFRMTLSGSCPSRYHDVYIWVVSAKRRTESKHVDPPC